MNHNFYIRELSERVFELEKKVAIQEEKLKETKNV